ncbi:MAG: sialidase family protein [Verrucomicrobiota bacterium]
MRNDVLKWANGEPPGKMASKETLNHRSLRFLFPLCLLLQVLAVPASGAADWRNITTGLTIPDENYSDMPYIVQSPDGSNDWLAVLTTGPGSEGDINQHIIAMASTNQGASWSTPVDIEPSAGVEASWGVPYMSPSGRVYVFYTYNHLRNLSGGSPVTASRQDVQGSYVYKYSDDFGQTWSTRYEIPYRQTSVDLNNYCPGVASGEVNMFWGCGKVIEQAGNVLVPFAKVGTYLVGDSEGWLVRSTNLMSETNPAQIHWEMVPAGDAGIKNPALGSISSEQNGVPLANGDLYMVQRTVSGAPSYSTSSNGGDSWTLPKKLTYAEGRAIKHPRANCKVWKASNGKYLLWYHNNSTTSFDNRNPVWLSGGIETNGIIAWSEPEILLFDPDPNIRISYPDFIEHDGQYWITETQKWDARTHGIPPSLLHGLWGQFTNSAVATHGLQIDLDLQASPVSNAPMPVLGSLAGESGFALDFWVCFNSLSAGQVLFDTRTVSGEGFVVRTTADNRLEISLDDGARTAAWGTDPGILVAGYWQHVAVIVDGSADTVTFVVDGRLLDGGTARQFGWSRFSTALGDINGEPSLGIGSSLDGELGQFRLYDRYLRTSEAVGNFRAWTSPTGPPPPPPPVDDRFRYDGTYEPDSATPPSGNSTWLVYTAGALNIVPNSPAPGESAFNDHDTENRMAMTHSYTTAGFNADPADYEWSYTFGMELETKPSDDTYLMLFGVRSEGAGNGKAVMLAFDSGGRLGFANAGGTGIQFSDLGGGGTDYDDETTHRFRVEKRDDGTAMEINTYVDGTLVDARAYSSFPDDNYFSDGFGLWSSTPGTQHVIVDEVQFGLRPATILDFSLVPGTGIMQLVVNVPGAKSHYYPVAATNLLDGTWIRAAHSTNGVDGFVVTNLDYSTSDVTGTNEVIYVRADEEREFFKMISE